MKTYRYGWILLFAAAALAAMACNVLGDIAEKAQQVENFAETAQALATAGQGIVTEVEGSGLVQTALAMATQAEESGLLETMQAAVTSIPEYSADIKATAEAAVTQGSYGEAPANIPLPPGDVNNFFGSDSLVTYSTPSSVNELVDFYRQEMPYLGWEPGEDTTVLTSTYALLAYKNTSQHATITITSNPLNDESLVVISIFQ